MTYLIGNDLPDKLDVYAEVAGPKALEKAEEHFRELLASDPFPDELVLYSRVKGALTREHALEKKFRKPLE